MPWVSETRMAILVGLASGSVAAAAAATLGEAGVGQVQKVRRGEIEELVVPSELLPIQILLDIPQQVFVGDHALTVDENDLEFRIDPDVEGM